MSYTSFTLHTPSTHTRREDSRWIVSSAAIAASPRLDVFELDIRTLIPLAGLMIGNSLAATVLVSRRAGSWLLLGVIYTTLEITPDEPHAPRCGTCSRCLDICPTQAFPAPHKLDARRCLAYLSIEHKGPIPHEFRGPMGNRIFGCDDCLAVCPWNRFAGAARDQRLSARRDIALRPLAELLRLDDLAFRTLFARTPVKRTGRDRFLRNCLIAAGNSGDMSLLESVIALLRDDAPVVRAMAVWALARLAPRRFQPRRDADKAEDHQRPGVGLGRRADI